MTGPLKKSHLPQMWRWSVRITSVSGTTEPRYTQLNTNHGPATAASVASSHRHPARMAGDDSAISGMNTARSSRASSVSPAAIPNQPTRPSSAAASIATRSAGPSSTSRPMADSRNGFASTRARPRTAAANGSRSARATLVQHHAISIAKPTETTPAAQTASA